jgi:hypothetical protein
MEIRQYTGNELEAFGREAYESGDERLFSLIQECLQHRRRQRGGTIWAESGVSAGTGQGFVRITWNDEETQLDPALAKGLGQSIIDAAYSAEHDAYFVAFLTSKVGLSREKAAMALGDLRAARARQDEQDARPS